MILGNSQQNLEFMMGDQKLLFTNMEKDLGVLISDDQEWNDHVKNS
jgi:hypothetical protein